MSEAIRFLHALAQALSTTALYAPGHPAAARAIDTLWEALEALMAVEEEPTFLFLGGAPIHAGRALHELSGWPWGPRLSTAGIQRVEFDADAAPAGLTEFLVRTQLRLASGPDADTSEASIEGIRFGLVEVAGEGEQESDDLVAEPESEEPEELVLDLTDELAAMAWILEEAREGRVARSEADTVVRILASQLERHPLPQVAVPEDFMAYPAYLAVNGALLAMAASQSAGIDRRGRHGLGVAALMADIGMTQLGEPFELRDSLPAQERTLMETHTTRGAQLLIEVGGRGFELAATVALEHHLRPDGNGYPARRYAPPPHWASRLVGVCAAYSALRAPRPFRPPWSALRAVGYLEEVAGTVFDIEAAGAVSSLVRAALAE
jgi:HD-GYP domain-containing protein (c-di-GMP phosphodiesterase class II)